MTKRFLVLSGLPASGKSTLGRAMAESFGLDWLDKDDFLEALFETDPSPAPDVAWRRRLSLAADDAFAAAAGKANGAVLASWWRHPRSMVDSGTPIGWLGDLAGTVVEVHCACDPQVAADRFLARQRHPGHLDARWSRPDLLASFALQAALGPLGCGPVVVVDACQPPVLGPLRARIDRLFAA